MMLAALLSLLGVGGVGGIALRMFGWGGVKSAAGKVSPKVWLALGVAAALGVGYLAHQHRAHNALKAAHDTGYAEGVAKTKADQAVAQRAANARAERINSTVRKESDEKDRADTRDADDLRLRGPGRARSCPPAAAGATGGHIEAAAKPDAAGPQVPGGDWVTVPWKWLVGRAEEHDHLLNEDHAWRKADDLQRAETGGSRW